MGRCESESRGGGVVGRTLGEGTGTRQCWAPGQRRGSKVDSEGGARTGTWKRQEGEKTRGEGGMSEWRRLEEMSAGRPGANSLGRMRAEARGPRGSLRTDPKATRELDAKEDGAARRGKAHRVRSRLRRKEREMCAWLQGQRREKVENRSGKIPREGNDRCGQESREALPCSPPSSDFWPQCFCSFARKEA